ncbi:MAG: phosphatidylglycerophosphatase A [Aquificaceae bacterium]
MLYRALATCFGIGNSKFAPGTLGTLFGAILVSILKFEIALKLLIGAFLLAVAIWASGAFAKEIGEKDPENVVIDEAAGIYACFLFIEPHFSNLVSGFLVFRAFDIIKPFPIRVFEKFPGGFGIVLDDVVAGILSGILLKLLINI